MKKLALISALLLAASPAAAQVATSLSQQQLGGQCVQSAATQAPTTGVLCIEENDRDILQRTQRSERRSLRVERRVHIEQCVRNKQRVCIERRC
jgi:hypothetical protein